MLFGEEQLIQLILQLVNAANQVNAQNLLNISNWALSSLWQQWRDEASWVNTSSENAANRNHNLAMAALERSTVLDLQDKASKDSLYELIGRFGFEVLTQVKIHRRLNEN